MRLLFTSLIMVCGFSMLKAQALVYKPVNPAFGGDTFNYQWLQSSAEAQNKHKEKTTETETKSDLQRFKESLNSQLLSQISSQLYRQQFGTEGLSEGSYTFGTYAVDVYPSTDGLSVNILDTATGEQTQIIIPKK